MPLSGLQRPRTTLGKLRALNWGLVGLLMLISCFGFILLFDAAGGSFDPYASRQMVRFGIGLLLILFLAVIDIQILFRIGYPLYAVALALLVLVELKGYTAMGATRWLEVGGFRLQPSELMKIALILALARYYHARPLGVISKIPFLLPPLFMIGAPFVLTVMQPDLGTALLIAMIGLGMMFAGGVSWRFFAFIITAGICAIPIGWQFLHSYQQKRVLTFLNPESDPLGAGYHILQSKIAIGSAGVWGKGFLAGTQSHLKFLPEKHTDFIFTLLAEEFGMMGAVLLIALYLALLLVCFFIAMRCRSQFGGLMSIGVALAVFLYAFINMAMVMGLMPVVGVPLPFVSYGGTSLLTLMMAMGLVMNTHIHRDSNLPGAPGITHGRMFSG